MKTYGYARVSSRDQNPARQLQTLREFPIPEEQIFVDHQSGATFTRPSWKHLLRIARRGDIIVVHSIDRLGRNYTEIQEVWKKLTKERGIQLVVLDMPLLDTRHTPENLTQEFVADLVLQIMSYVAQNEREAIHRRQAEGIAKAKRKGIKFGNPGKPLPADFREVVGEWRNHAISLNEALEQLECSRSYFYKNVKQLGL